MADELTTEEIAQNYTAMGHCVNVINSSKEPWQSDSDWNERAEVNKRYLRIMVAKDYWTDEDMTAVNAAIGG